jgi:HEPN domain-containing protein
MPVEKAAAWIRKAESDFLAADNNLAAANVPHDAVCFHCQQAAEKYLKALLASLGAPSGRTHDLMALLQDARTYLATAPPEEVENACIILNPYSIEVRYPDDESDPTTTDSMEAREAAETVRRWVRSIVPK